MGHFWRDVCQNPTNQIGPIPITPSDFGLFTLLRPPLQNPEIGITEALLHRGSSDEYDSLSSGTMKSP